MSICLTVNPCMLHCGIKQKCWLVKLDCIYCTGVMDACTTHNREKLLQTPRAGGPIAGLQ